MRRSIDQITSEVRQLGSAEKSLIISDLLADPDGDPDTGADAAWRLVNRRVEEIEQGTVTLTPANEVLERARKRLE